MRGDGGVAGEGELLVYQSFIPGVKYTMSLTIINSDWMSNTSSGLRIIKDPRNINIQVTKKFSE